ncbi:MAG: hypothetical protein H6607_08925 [Flavobacteriales bacterium]|nr:hypothetical protein [Flavobacteriales bacterium]
MKQPRKIILWLAIALLAFGLLCSPILWLLNMEFASDTIKSDYKLFLFFALPAAVLLTLFGTLKIHDNRRQIFAKTIITILMAAMVAFIMLLSLLSDMCAWTNRQVLFENKLHPTTKIIVRDFGCGATDGGSPVIDVFRVEHFRPFFIRATRIDTATINKNEWVRIR